MLVDLNYSFRQYFANGYEERRFLEFDTETQEVVCRAVLSIPLNHGVHLIRIPYDCLSDKERFYVDREVRYQSARSASDFAWPTSF